jgi:hypothetical protein
MGLMRTALPKDDDLVNYAALIAPGVRSQKTAHC